MIFLTTALAMLSVAQAHSIPHHGRSGSSISGGSSGSRGSSIPEHINSRSSSSSLSSTQLSLKPLSYRDDKNSAETEASLPSSSPVFLSKDVRTMATFLSKRLLNIKQRQQQQQEQMAEGDVATKEERAQPDRWDNHFESQLEQLDFLVADKIDNNHGGQEANPTDTGTTGTKSLSTIEPSQTAAAATSNDKEAPETAFFDQMNGLESLLDDQEQQQQQQHAATTINSALTEEDSTTATQPLSVDEEDLIASAPTDPVTPIVARASQQTDLEDRRLTQLLQRANRTPSATTTASAHAKKVQKIRSELLDQQLQRPRNQQPPSSDVHIKIDSEPTHRKLLQTKLALEQQQRHRLHIQQTSKTKELTHRKLLETRLAMDQSAKDLREIAREDAEADRLYQQELLEIEQAEQEELRLLERQELSMNAEANQRLLLEARIEIERHIKQQLLLAEQDRIEREQQQVVTAHQAQLEAQLEQNKLQKSDITVELKQASATTEMSDEVIADPYTKIDKIQKLFTAKMDQQQRLGREAIQKATKTEATQRKLLEAHLDMNAKQRQAHADKMMVQADDNAKQEANQKSKETEATRRKLLGAHLDMDAKQRQAHDDKMMAQAAIVDDTTEESLGSPAVTNPSWLDLLSVPSATVDPAKAIDISSLQGAIATDSQTDAPFFLTENVPSNAELPKDAPLWMELLCLPALQDSETLGVKRMINALPLIDSDIDKAVQDAVAITQVKFCHSWANLLAAESSFQEEAEPLPNELMVLTKSLNLIGDTLDSKQKPTPELTAPEVVKAWEKIVKAQLAQTAEKANKSIAKLVQDGHKLAEDTRERSKIFVNRTEQFAESAVESASEASEGLSKQVVETSTSWISSLPSRVKNLWGYVQEDTRLTLSAVVPESVMSFAFRKTDQNKDTPNQIEAQSSPVAHNAMGSTETTRAKIQPASQAFFATPIEKIKPQVTEQAQVPLEDHVDEPSKTHSIKTVDIEIVRNLPTLSVEDAKASWLSFVWEEGGGLPVVIVPSKSMIDGVHKRRLLLPSMLEEELLELSADQVKEAGTVVIPYRVAQMGTFGPDLINDSHDALVKFEKTPSGTKMTWKVQFDVRNRYQLWWRVTRSALNTASDNLVSYLAEPMVITHDSVLKTTPEKALDAWQSYVFWKGGGLPIPPPIEANNSTRLVVPPFLRETISGIDRELKEIQYTVENPGLLSTYPVYSHQGRVSFESVQGDNGEECAKMKWTVEVRPYRNFNGYVRSYTNTIISSLSTNLKRHLEQPGDDKDKDTNSKTVSTLKTSLAKTKTILPSIAQYGEKVSNGLHSTTQSISANLVKQSRQATQKTATFATQTAEKSSKWSQKAALFNVPIALKSVWMDVVEDFHVSLSGALPNFYADQSNRAPQSASSPDLLPTVPEESSFSDSNTQDAMNAEEAKTAESKVGFPSWANLLAMEQTMITRQKVDSLVLAELTKSDKMASEFDELINGSQGDATDSELEWPELLMNTRDETQETPIVSKTNASAPRKKQLSPNSYVLFG